MDNNFDEKTKIFSAIATNEKEPKSLKDSHPCIVQYSGESLGVRYILDKVMQIVGRSPDSSIVVMDPSVSRKHAEINVQNGVVSLIDLGSSNGTLVNGKSIDHRADLKDQDLIQFGAVTFKFYDEHNLDGYIQDKIYKLATIDGGTGIYNKKYILDSIDAHYKISKSTGKQLCLIYFDLDHFKKVNDTYGHNAGDELLKSLVDRVKTVTRKDDVFGRFGGEEFVLLLPNTTKQEAADLAERIRKSVSEQAFVLTSDNQQITHHQTISLGVEACGSHTKSPRDLLEVADQKLYTSKQTGRNKVTL